MPKSRNMTTFYKFMSRNVIEESTTSAIASALLQQVENQIVCHKVDRECR